MVGNDELGRCPLEGAKRQGYALVQGLSLPACETNELLSAIDEFWQDKQTGNRLIHDDWFPSLIEPGSVATRGITRAKKPELILGDRTVDEVWALAERR
jgi:hypothetical protein